MSLPPVIHYDAPFPLYGLAFSNSPSTPHRAALTSFITGPSNKLSVVDLAPRSHSHSHSPSHSHATHQHQHQPPPSPSAAAGPSEYVQLASASLPFPATKVAFEPGPSGSGHGRGHAPPDGRGELLVTSGDVLRVWELGMDWSGGEERGMGGYVGRNGYQGGMGGAGYSLGTRSVLTNSKSPSMSLPPITSFSWNALAPERVVSCSTDTTATLWNIETSQAVTQLIAHDRAVYDLSWLPDSSDIFVSVGADGSLRAFDLRQLEHSTILYESANDTPLAKIAFSNREQHMLACFGEDESKVLILDMRSPGQPVAELVGHQGALNAIQWGGGGDVLGTTSGGWIASCADDGQMLLYDLSTPLPESRPSSTRPSDRASKNHSQGQGRHHGGSMSTSPNPHPNPTNSHGHTAKSPLVSNLLPPPSVSPRSHSSTSGLTSPSPSAAGSAGAAAESPGASSAHEVLPARAWDAGHEVNNLAFTREGTWVGCVAGARMSVLRC